MPALKPTSDALKETIAYLKDKASDKTNAEAYCELNEFYNADDASGGNFDDAYQFGCDDGEIMLARNILDMLRQK